MDPIDKKSIESFFDVFRSEEDWVSINGMYSDYEMHCFAHGNKLKLLSQDDFYKGLEICVNEEGLDYLLAQNMFKREHLTIMAIQFFYRDYQIVCERKHLQQSIPDINPNRSIRSRL